MLTTWHLSAPNDLILCFPTLLSKTHNVRVEL